MHPSRRTMLQWHIGRIPVAHPTGCLGGSTSRRRGVTLIEILLVFATIACVVLGSQFWNEFRPQIQNGEASEEHSPREDLPPISDVAIAPNQREAVSVGMDGQLQIHDLRSRSGLAAIPNSNRESRSACYSPDGNNLLVSSRSGQIELWSFSGDLPTSKSVHAHDGDIHWCQFAPDGSRFVTCGDDHRCVLWDANTLRVTGELPGIKATVRRACFFADGTRLLTGDINGHLHLWDLATQRLIKQLDVSGPARPFKTFVEGIALLSEESEILIVLRGGGICVWDLESGEQRRAFQHDGREFTSLSVSSDGRRAVSGSMDGQIDVWDVATGTCLQSFAGHTGPVQALAMTGDRRLAVSAGWDGYLRFWEI